MGHSKGSPEREIHSDTGLPKQNRKISNQQPNLTSKITRGTTNKAQSKQKEGNNQDQRRIKQHRD